jgi:hypothetical protein
VQLTLRRFAGFSKIRRLKIKSFSGKDTPLRHIRVVLYTHRIDPIFGFGKNSSRSKIHVEKLQLNIVVC